MSRQKMFVDRAFGLLNCKQAVIVILLLYGTTVEMLEIGDIDEIYKNQ